jgi:hypothetical protein
MTNIRKPNMHPQPARPILTLDRDYISVSAMDRRELRVPAASRSSVARTFVPLVSFATLLRSSAVSAWLRGCAVIDRKTRPGGPSVGAPANSRRFDAESQVGRRFYDVCEHNQ